MLLHLLTYGTHVGRCCAPCVVLKYFNATLAMVVSSCVAIIAAYQFSVAQLYFSYKCGYDMHLLRHLKEELACAIDEWLLLPIQNCFKRLVSKSESTNCLYCASLLLLGWFPQCASILRPHPPTLHTTAVI